MKNQCKHCHSQNIIKSGFTSYNKQRYLCKSCRRKFVEDYTYQAYNENINQQIVILTKEGLGIRSTARVLKISTTTLLKRILYIASAIKQPQIIRYQTYEVDELRTYIGNKKRPIWVIYAINSITKCPVCLKVGRRNKRNLKEVIDTLLLSNSKKIFTDKLPMYNYLIEDKIHSTKFRGINHIERNHLSLRTHLKRLNRRTICFSKSLVMLSAIIKIYFWS
ncbi:MAG: IS1 family transposase [Flavobacteriaceae bacterium]